jgi:hypothetical protein
VRAGDLAALLDLHRAVVTTAFAALVAEEAFQSEEGRMRLR